MSAVDTVEFGPLLRRLRVAAGLTQEELAERAGLSVRGISDLERGARRTPQRDTLELLAAALMLSPLERARFEAAARPSVARLRTVDDVGIVAVGRISAPLVGRDHELRAIERHLSDAGPPVLLLAGEPGIGKSRLLSEAARLPTMAGMIVVHGGCQRRSGEEPYAPILDALARHAGALGSVDRRAALQGCAGLSRLLPDTMDDDGHEHPAPSEAFAGGERRFLFAAVSRFLRNVAGPAGTLLVLDDLQWAGPDALDLLVALATSAAHGNDAGRLPSVRMIGAYRDVEVGPDHPLSSALGDLAHAGLVRRLALNPLSPADSAELVRSLLGQGSQASPIGLEPSALGADALRKPARTEPVEQRIVQRAGGVPFFIISCAQGVSSGAIAADEVPWDLAQSLRQRVASLPAPGQTVLGVAAVAGRIVRRELLLHVAALPEDDVLDGLDAVARARLMAEEGEHDYRFVHDVIREVVEAGLGSARRTLLHRRIAQYLEGSNGDLPVELLAYHHGRSGEEEKAARYLTIAGDRALASYATAAAEAYYRESAERLDSVPRPLAAAGVREKLGFVLRIMACHDAAREALDGAIRIYGEVDDVEALARATAQKMRIPMGPDEVVANIAHVRELTVRLAARLSPGGLAQLYAALANMYLLVADAWGQVEAGERAASLAREAGDDATLVAAELRRGTGFLALNRYQEALRIVEDVMPLVDRSGVGVGELDNLWRALNNSGSLYLEFGEVARAQEQFERCLRSAERVGSPLPMANMSLQLARCAFTRGDWTAAEDHARRSLDLIRQIGDPRIGAGFRFGPLLFLVDLALARGDLEEARRHLGLIQVSMRAAGEDGKDRDAQHSLAKLRLAEGKPEQAIAVLEDVIASSRDDIMDMYLAPLLVTLALAYCANGRPAEATAAVAQADTLAANHGLRYARVSTLRARGIVEAQQERWIEAASTLEESAALARNIGFPYAEAQARASLAQVIEKLDQPERAHDEMDGALTIFRRLGAALNPTTEPRIESDAIEEE